MAAWQFDVELVPADEPSISSDAPWAHYPASLTAIDAANGLLRPATSWSQSLLMWGVEDGNRLDIWVEGGAVQSISGRVDMREPAPEEFCHSLEAVAQAVGAVFRTPSGLVLDPQNGELYRAAATSPAARFVEDPEAFLRRVRLGGVEDT